MKSFNQTNDACCFDKEDCKPAIDVEVSASKMFCVVLHDVAGCFLPELRDIVQQIQMVVNGTFACAVVPNWHGEGREEEFAEVLSICGGCAEWMIHGMTHHREAGGGLVSWLTKGADEFGGMGLAEIQDRTTMSQERIQAGTGTRPVGLVAPCWRLPVAPQKLNGIKYVLGYNRLVPCLAVRNRRSSEAVQLATWSYDWGRFGSVASAVNQYPALRLKVMRNMTPCVVIHPADVVRGWLPLALSRIESLLNLGYQPVIPRKLLLAGSVSAS